MELVVRRSAGLATLAKVSFRELQLLLKELFDDLKAANPADFGTKTFDDVDFIQEDPIDTSFIEIRFKVETA